ncbi:MAG TPA: imidazoleglycerol-phosphate dehydratase HisB [Clostridia bacterium]|nr:imidazoleglycerol-phosphate dehydratase HisB [Clostridia bacterium]
MRTASANRKTKETDISLYLNIDGTGKAEISTGCGFLDHMLQLFAAHSKYDLKIVCSGDLQVDSHHTVEDTAIVLGECFKKALQDKRGICRYGSFTLAMDEALVMVALDISGRSYLNYNVAIIADKVGDFDTELGEEFMQAFTRSAGITLHIEQLEGKNAHHILEAIFKALARALKQATKIDPDAKDEIPSTKGVL